MRLANARGVPGTLGCLALTLHERRFVLVTTHHVLYGAGARNLDPVFLIRGDAPSPTSERIAEVRWGRRGTVSCGGVGVHVDCAVAELDMRSIAPHGWRVTPDITAATAPAAGTRVAKAGAATGITEGVIVASAQDETVRAEGRTFTAPRQIVIRSSVAGRPFSAAGDSGSMVRDESGALLGILWGVNARGYSLVSPIGPALWVLHVRPVRLHAPENPST